MKKLTSLLAIFLAMNLSAAGSIEIIFSTPLEQLPEGHRIENDGIYGISSFDYVDGNFFLQNFDSRKIYKADGNSFIETAFAEISSPYFNFNQNDNGYPINHIRNNIPGIESRSHKVEFLQNNLKNEISMTLPDGSIITLRDVDYVEPIGFTSDGLKLFLTETIKNNIPLEVHREIYVLDKTGSVINVFEVPLVKYLYTENEFTLGDNDELLQLITTEDSFMIIRYNHYQMTSRYDYSFLDTQFLHYNQFVKTDEFVPPAPTKTLPTANRLYAVKLGEQHAELKYSVTQANLAYENTQGPDGDVVRTPGWLFEGVNARIPYKWGGFQNVSSYLNGLANGRYAGDINTAGVSGYAVGNDCSGFVSRCWQLNEQYSTSMMPGITGQRASWDDIVMGDAIHKVGHVRLYLNRTNNGALRVVEAAGRNWDVSYWSFAPSDLTSYTPRYYVQMSPTVNENFVKVLSAKYITPAKVELLVAPEATPLGYKVYYSEDGDSWYFLGNDLSSNSDSIVVDVESQKLYFRVAAIDDIGGNNVEGFWSNIVAASYTAKSKNAIIIDGFSRNYGSGNWQGYIHNFVKGYADYLMTRGVFLQTISSSRLADPNFDLNSFQYVYWIVGDESTVDETFSDEEQNLIKEYLEAGGNLFLSGSEIGWDLWEKGSSSDRDFYTNYLKAQYIADDAGITTVAGVEGTFLEGTEFHIGQTYTEDYPDQIVPVEGGDQILLYTNGKGAGISYDGIFGNGSRNSKIVYIGFPMESTANDEQFEIVMHNSFMFFNDIVITNQKEKHDLSFEIYQNYPNPFNPKTFLSFQLDEVSDVSIDIYNINGELVTELVDEELQKGYHQYEFNAIGISSGIYFANFIINDKLHVQKITLLK
ncbi:MAG: hypothetical protein SCALA702_31660 [Melioribacteraceae bacterium]|nr:MAG: hypothetical protein SCALA702_31660 [Melioribacteraceae bacterium]